MPSFRTRLDRLTGSPARALRIEDHAAWFASLTDAERAAAVQTATAQLADFYPAHAVAS